MPERQPPPDECAQCGAVIPRAARACPECGADERTGWRESSLYDGLDLPDSAFAADPADRSDRPQSTAPHRVNGVAWYWWLAGLVVIVILVVTLVGGR